MFKEEDYKVPTIKNPSSISRSSLGATSKSSTFRQPFSMVDHGTPEGGRKLVGVLVDGNGERDRKVRVGGG